MTVVLGIVTLFMKYYQTHHGSREDKARLFQKTQSHYQTCINNDNMVRDTQLYFDSLNPLQEQGMYPTKFSVENEDTYNVLLRLKVENPSDTPVGLNMANRYRPGGGVKSGAPAQEEELCRRSNLYCSLESQKYPLPEKGGLYSLNVQVFREDESHDFEFMKESVAVDMVSVAAYDLRSGSRDRTSLGLPANGTISTEILKLCDSFINGTKAKIRNMLRIMSTTGHTRLGLGALGCGAFQTPPAVMAELFQEDEFRGRFEEVIFAILVKKERDKTNITSFEEMCNRLNQDFLL